MERYDSTTGTWVGYVQIPTLSHNVDTTFYLLYGNAKITSQQANASQVWDGSNTGVYHFEGPPLSVADSTSYSHSALKTNLSYTSAGLVGGAASGINAGAFLPATLLDQLSGTFEIWLSTTRLQDKSHSWTMLSQAGPTKDDYFRLGWSAADNAFEAVWSSSKNGASRLAFNAAQAPIASKGWAHVAYTWNSGTNLQSLYLNGVLLGSSSQTLPVISSGNAIALGSNTQASFNGLLDETRFSDVVQSSDWIAAEYRNQISLRKFVSVGTDGQ